jgi:hypothetical protein
MRTALPAILSLTVFLTITLVWARWGGIQPGRAVEAATEPSGDDQARVIVRDIDMVPSDRPGDGIDAIQGSPRMMHFAYLVTFEVTNVLRGQFPKQELHILVHSPSADLGVSSGSQRGILHRYRSASGRTYQFVPETSARAGGR